MTSYQSHKQVVRDFAQAIDRASADQVGDVLAHSCAEGYTLRASFPLRVLDSPTTAAERFWKPLKRAFTRLQRREDIFFAGENEIDGQPWVISMGHFMGLFDQPWLDIPPNGRIAMIRYAEFSRVEHERIAEQGLFVDVLGVMRQAGVDPLPPETGRFFVYPGPKTHDGILLEPKDAAESAKTLALVNQMIADLDRLNVSGQDRCPPELLARSWHDDMIWYGPAGIGATYTIERYQEQHQHPFRLGLKNKVFNGHVCRLAEGDYAGFFGWPNLTNTAAGGFLGLPANEVRADMQVVDIYRRDGDKLAENWVIIDLPHWLHQQGLDVFARMRSLIT